DYGVRPPDFRLPPTTRLGPVTLQIGDLERSMAYYRKIFGAEEASPSGGEVTLRAPGAEEPLIVLRERPGAQSMARHARLGLFHYAILLPDRASLGSFVRHLDALGVSFGASDHLVSEAVYLYDPDGLGIEVYADRPRSAWRHQNRQLLMATDPMDVDAVVDSAAGVAWRGLPAGTTMGHVHLHVGDLREAEEFYHEEIGLDKMVWSYPGALFLGAGGYHHHLGLNTWAPGAPPPGDDDAQLLEWVLVAPESDKAGLFADPWGTKLRIHARED
ncbi:MAG: VOC family protein, partial [Gemmatimonadetes bacterium]|nr:VOC family protein [Gemmatimonadota bacterium]